MVFFGLLFQWGFLTMSAYDRDYFLPGADLDERLEEMERFFMGEGKVHTTLRRLARRLEDENIPYAVIGGMALFLHGFARETLDVDLILTPEGLKEFHDKLVGRGYLPAFAGASKTFKDTATSVKVEVTTTGEDPGGKPGPIVFPDPETASVERQSIQVIALEKLIDLKLISGLTASYRLRDLADVQDLIIHLGLPLELAERLDQSVQAEYRRLWELAQHRHEGPHEREP